MLQALVDDGPVVNAEHPPFHIRRPIHQFSLCRGKRDRPFSFLFLFLLLWLWLFPVDNWYFGVGCSCAALHFLLMSAVWGPALWADEERSIEALPATPQDDPREAIPAKVSHLRQLPLLLRCEKCRRHYAHHAVHVCKWMADRDMPMDRTATRARLHYYLWLCHTMVHLSKHNREAATTYSWEWYKKKYPGARGPLTNGAPPTIWKID
jgi:hypothetical protein